MPKKTKKEKLLARYHKKLRELENNTGAPMKKIEEKVQAVVTPKIEKVSEVDIQNNKYFYTDLKKSLLLIFLIIGVEVGLFFAKLIK